MLIDRLSNRLGRQAVVRRVPLSDAQPEHACLDLPLAGESLSRAAQPQTHRTSKRSRSALARTPRSATIFQPDERPLFLRKQPLLLHDVRFLRRGIPRAFALAGRRYRLIRACGPERIETGWWRSGLIRRDYYRVETVTGSRYWLFHDLRHDRWFLHGEFA